MNKAEKNQAMEGIRWQDALRDIPGSDGFAVIERIDKGFSNDQKLYIETDQGEKQLLRLSPLTSCSRKQAEFEIMKRAAELGTAMPRPLSFGLCQQDEKVYTLLSWCEGEDAREQLARLPLNEQYRLGLEAGHQLRVLHSLPAPPELESWHQRYGSKTSRKIRAYKDCGITFKGDGKIIRYLERNRVLLESRPQGFQHGDYHVGNMVISPGSSLQIIDFDRFDYGDPWEEFNRIVWSAQLSPVFASGQIHGYFKGEPPEGFFALLAYYMGCNALSSIPWSIPYGTQEVGIMIAQAGQVLDWFDGMSEVKPAWYAEQAHFRNTGFYQERSM